MSLHIINIYVYIYIHTQRSLATINSIGFKLLKGKKQSEVNQLDQENERSCTGVIDLKLEFKKLRPEVSTLRDARKEDRDIILEAHHNKTS